MAKNTLDAATSARAIGAVYPSAEVWYERAIPGLEYVWVEGTRPWQRGWPELYRDHNKRNVYIRATQVDREIFTDDGRRRVRLE